MSVACQRYAPPEPLLYILHSPNYHIPSPFSICELHHVSSLTLRTEPTSWDPREYLSHAEIVGAIHHALTLSFERGTAAHGSLVDATPESVSDREGLIEIWKEIGAEVTKRLTPTSAAQGKDKVLFSATMTISRVLIHLSEGVVTEEWTDAETDSWIRMLSSQIGLCQDTLMGCPGDESS